MKDGDIYFWRWKDPQKHADSGAYQSYHCCSRMAVAENGRLYDTFWSDHSKPLNLNQIENKYQGNKLEMTEIQSHLALYYRSEDIVDMRHSNSSRAPIYRKAGAERDAETMRAHIKYKIEQSESEIRVAESRIERLNEAAELIKAGELDEVYL